ncbi:MAG: hypothetical protein V2A66_09130, partial [Pseudomonadota bacterium]
MPYFSDREKGPRLRIQDEVPPAVWGGIVSLITTLIANGSFGLDFPEVCPDGAAIIGTNAHAMKLAIKAEIPNLQRREKHDVGWGDEGEPEDITVDYWPLNPSQQPDTLTILDVIEFCYRHAAEPSQQVWHPFPKHHHLTFDREIGHNKFRDTINTIFSRNGLVYALLEDGRIIRTPPPVLENLLRDFRFDTSDAELDDMLATACDKFLSRNAKIRRESLEKLWDAWERIKTLLPGKDKKDGAEKLLNMAAPEESFRAMLNNEAITLTKIGNSFQIRHSETDKTPVNAGKHIDYLFHRLFSIIYLLL